MTVRQRSANKELITLKADVALRSGQTCFNKSSLYLTCVENEHWFEPKGEHFHKREKLLLLAVGFGGTVLVLAAISGVGCRDGAVVVAAFGVVGGGVVFVVAGGGAAFVVARGGAAFGVVGLGAAFVVVGGGTGLVVVMVSGGAVVVVVVGFSAVVVLVMVSGGAAAAVVLVVVVLVVVVPVVVVLVVVVLVVGFGGITDVLVVSPGAVVVLVVDIGAGAGSEVVGAACTEVPLIMERTRTRTVVRA